MKLNKQGPTKCSIKEHVELFRFDGTNTEEIVSWSKGNIGMNELDQIYVRGTFPNSTLINIGDIVVKGHAGRCFIVSEESAEHNYMIAEIQ